MKVWIQIFIWRDTFARPPDCEIFQNQDLFVNEQLKKIGFSAKTGQNRVVGRLGCENQQLIVKKNWDFGQSATFKHQLLFKLRQVTHSYIRQCWVWYKVIATGNLLSSVAREMKIRCGTITTPTTAMRVLTTKSHGDYELSRRDWKTLVCD